MTQTQQFDADVQATEPEGLVPFTYAGKSYICQRTPIVDKQMMVEAGFELGFDFTIEVRLSQFVTPDRAPANSEHIFIGDTEYVINGTTPDQYGVVTHYAVKQVS
jgi:hypothetical protein